MNVDAVAAVGLGPEDPALWLIIALALFSLLIGAYAARTAGRASRLRRDLERARVEQAKAEARAAELEPARAELAQTRSLAGRLEAERAAQDARLAERERSLVELKARMDAEFQAAAAKTLEDAHRSFLQRAGETFEKYREAAGADAEKKRKALDDLIRPMTEQLSRYEKGLAEFKETGQKDRGELLSRIGDLARISHDARVETQKLTTALRSGAKVRGRWGEEQLRNVVELAGMAAYVDFSEQKTVDAAESRRRPDMVVNLPGGRKIAIDAKVSITAYLDALDAPSEEARAERIAQHANDLWTHVRALAAKDYAADLRDALDIVVMFVPGENYFAAAMDARPQLFQEAFEKKVLVATPTTLLAMLKSASYVWRQEKSAENVVKVARDARDLYDSLKKMAEHLSGVGTSLEKALERYNAAIGSFETRVLSRARRFAEHEIQGVEAEIAALREIDGRPRALREARGSSDDDGAEAA
jgi:DNA recombination protein RmuC